MADWKGFWSYVHDDDVAECGRISQLARDVASQFEMVTAEKIDLFLDQDAIHWGDNWRDRIDETLASTAFFIPVLTPRDFMSAECRRELHYFARKASELGIKDLVLPLVYIDVASLHDEKPDDDLVALVKTFQWENWTELRFEDIGSGKYRKGIASLAVKLVEANTKANQAEQVASARELEELPEPADAQPGRLDLLAETETTFPEWIATMKMITSDIQLIGNFMDESKKEIDQGAAQGKGFAARLASARKLSQKLNEPVERIWNNGNKFATQLHQLDDGVRILIEAGPVEVSEQPENMAAFCGLFASLRELAAASHESLTHAQGMIDAISPIESLSRDLRAPLKRLRQGLTTMVEAREVTEEWLRLIDDSDLDCVDKA